MNNSLVCVGLSHHQAPVEIRERVAFHSDRDLQGLAVLREYPNIEEVAILNTCNRVEIYASGELEETSHAAEHFLHDFHRIPKETLSPHLYRFGGQDALTQLFRVASSLDSLIVGEPQIMGQVKDAYFKAKHVGSTGPFLHRAFSHAFFVAKRVRRETKIGENAVTVSFAAVELGKRIFGDLAGRNVLLIGAGEMSELTAQLFRTRGAHLLVTNRSFDKASVFAAKHGGLAKPLSELSEMLELADIVVASTRSPSVLIDKRMLTRTMKLRRFKPMLLIDIAVPRNIDSRVSEIDGVYIYDIDDLGNVVSDNLEERKKQALCGEQIVQEEVSAFTSKLNEDKAIPLLKALKENGSQIAERELERTFQLMGSVDPMHRKQIEAMTRTIVNKMLHTPLTQLREHVKTDPETAEEFLATAQKIFGL